MLCPSAAPLLRSAICRTARDMLIQGLLRLLEPEVVIRCREVDRSVVESVLSAATSKYSKILSDEAGINKTVKLSVDKSGRYLPPPPSSDTSVPSW